MDGRPTAAADDDDNYNHDEDNDADEHLQPISPLLLVLLILLLLLLLLLFLPLFSPVGASVSGRMFVPLDLATVSVTFILPICIA